VAQGILGAGTSEVHFGGVGQLSVVSCQLSVGARGLLADGIFLEADWHVGGAYGIMDGNCVSLRIAVLKSYETIGTVESQGRVVVAGVPFAAGTEVAITISEKARAGVTAETANLEAARPRTRELFERLRGRNTEPIGPLRREELYDRKVLR
jgi:hypothetical protein